MGLYRGTVLLYFIRSSYEHSSYLSCVPYWSRRSSAYVILLWQSKISAKAAATHERSASAILERLLCAEISGGNIPNANGIEMIMVAGWYLWWDRRKISHKETCGSAARSAMSIRGIVANTLATKLKVPTRSMWWVRPATWVIKLNVDASYHPDAGSGAAGALMRDCTGAFIAASCSYKIHAMDAATMEAQALL